MSETKKYPDLEAKYGSENLFIIEGVDNDKRPFTLVCRKPDRRVLSAVLEEKKESKILDLYVNNCAVGGDLERLNNADVFGFVAGKIAEKGAGAKGELKKY